MGKLDGGGESGNVLLYYIKCFQAVLLNNAILRRRFPRVVGLLCTSPQWGAADAEIKVPSGENTSLKVLPFTPGVGQYIAIHATLTARDFFLAYFYPSCPFTCIFSKTSPDFSMCWLWLTHGSCVGPQNQIGHPAGCRFLC